MQYRILLVDANSSHEPDWPNSIRQMPSKGLRIPFRHFLAAWPTSERPCGCRGAENKIETKNFKIKFFFLKQDNLGEPKGRVCLLCKLQTCEKCHQNLVSQIALEKDGSFTQSLE